MIIVVHLRDRSHGSCGSHIFHHGCFFVSQDGDSSRHIDFTQQISSNLMPFEDLEMIRRIGKSCKERWKISFFFFTELFYPDPFPVINEATWSSVPHRSCLVVFCPQKFNEDLRIPPFKKSNCTSFQKENHHLVIPPGLLENAAFSYFSSMIFPLKLAFFGHVSATNVSLPKGILQNQVYV